MGGGADDVLDPEVKEDGVVMQKVVSLGEDEQIGKPPPRGARMPRSTRNCPPGISYHVWRWSGGVEILLFGIENTGGEGINDCVVSPTAGILSGASSRKRGSMRASRQRTPNQKPRGFGPEPPGEFWR